MVLHRLVDDPVAADVLHEPEGTGRHRVPLGPLLPSALDVTLRDDEGHGREQALGHLVAEDHRRFLEADGKSVGILDLHALDEAKLRR